MKKTFLKWLEILHGNQKNNVKFSKNNQFLLQRDLQNCYHLHDINQLRSVLHLCHEDFSTDYLLTFLLNISYQEHLIIYCNVNLNKERYSCHEIRTKFKSTQSYAVCDAILLHITRNENHYLSSYETEPALTDLSIFTTMANNQKEIILQQYKIYQND